jgi:hypothetical protein
MMKKLLILALASSAMVATPAAAADFDAIGQYKLSADAKSYCVFGQVNNSWTGQQNVVLADGNHSQGFAGADGAVKFDIQAADDTVKAASATYRIDKAVCNEPFKVTATSLNGGLKTTVTTTDTDFTSDVDYNARFTIDGINGPQVNTVATGANSMFTSAQAQAGVATLKLDIPVSSKLLLKASYGDILTLVMQPGA